MWEAIASNQRRSRILLSLMAVLLVTLGFAIGMTVDADPAAGGAMGALVALAVYLLMLMTALFAGSDILLSAAGARRIQKADHPRLWNIVEEMTIASGLPAPPAVYIIDDERPNAFAVGRRPDSAAVAVTAGLLQRLNRDELQGVIAHEIGHIRNQDTRFLTLAAVMVGAITIIGEIFLRSLRFRGSTRRSSRSEGGQAQAIFFLIAIVLALLAPLFARLLYFACSRRREFLADASSARFTRYPEGLASALEKISENSALAGEKASGVVAPLYIVNPLQESASVNLFATHPPTALRVRVLRAMGGMAGLSDYEAAYKNATEGKGGALGRLTLGETDSLPARPASAEPAESEQGRPEAPEDAIARVREVKDLLGRIGGFVAIPCTCGVNIKLPPNFKGDSVACPRCGARHEVPRAAPATAPAAAAPTTAEGDMIYGRRRPGEWESFRCLCGQSLQLSPLMAAPRMQCPACRRRIEIVAADPAATGGRGERQES